MVRCAYLSAENCHHVKHSSQASFAVVQFSSSFSSKTGWEGPSTRVVRAPPHFGSRNLQSLDVIATVSQSWLCLCSSGEIRPSTDTPNTVWTTLESDKFFPALNYVAKTAQSYNDGKVKRWRVECIDELTYDGSASVQAHVWGCSDFSCSKPVRFTLNISNLCRQSYNLCMRFLEIYTRKLTKCQRSLKSFVFKASTFHSTHFNWCTETY
jgi:hypothetical protein